MELKNGWNMISSPINVQIPTATIAAKCKLGDDSSTGAVWYFDNSLPFGLKSDKLQPPTKYKFVIG